MDPIAQFRKASSGQQFALAGLALLVILAALVALYLGVLRKPYGVLFSDLKPVDAASIVQQLDKKKTPYRLADGGTTILAPKSIIDATRLSLMGGDMPLKGTVGFEMFNKSDMGLTEFAQKINYQRALQGELERTIMSLDGVDTARVNLSLPQPSLFQTEASPPKASITLLMRPGRQVLAPSVVGIQRLVAAAVPDLTVENTVVLDEQGQIISGGAIQAMAPPTATAEAASPAADAKAAVEQFYAAQIRRAVSAAYPEAALTVRVDLPDRLAEVALQDWAPATRQFPLSIFIGLDRAERLDEAKRLAMSSVEFNPGIGDTIASAVQGAAPPPALPLNAARASPAPPSRFNPIIVRWALWIGFGGLLLIAGLVAVKRRPRGFPRTLTDAEREDYVRRLRALLNSGEIDASAS